MPHPSSTLGRLAEEDEEMNESARDEALRLWSEAHKLGAGRTPQNDDEVADTMRLSVHQLVHLIALARQRPGWVWVPEDPDFRMQHAMQLAAQAGCQDVGIYKAALAAAPNSEEGT
jgi:hypothetical protein